MKFLVNPQKELPKLDVEQVDAVDVTVLVDVGNAVGATVGGAGGVDTERVALVFIELLTVIKMIAINTKIRSIPLNVIIILYLLS